MVAVVPAAAARRARGAEAGDLQHVDLDGAVDGVEVAVGGRATLLSGSGLAFRSGGGGTAHFQQVTLRVAGTPDCPPQQLRVALPIRAKTSKGPGYLGLVAQMERARKAKPVILLPCTPVVDSLSTSPF